MHRIDSFRRGKQRPSTCFAGTPAAESAGKAASRAVEQAPASGGAVDRIAGSGLQPLQDPQQAGSAANQVLRSAEQAASSAASKTPPPPPPAAKQALSSAKQAVESVTQSNPSPAPPAVQQAAGSASQGAKEQAYSTLQSAQQGGGGSGGVSSQAARALSENASSASSAGAGGGAAGEQGLSPAADAGPTSGPDALSQLTGGRIQGIMPPAVVLRAQVAMHVGIPMSIVHQA